MTPTANIRSAKVRQIFNRFDANGDGGLNRDEMAALVVALNPRVKFSDEQVSSILDEVFRTYADSIVFPAGLTFPGLLRTYDDGAGDVDRDFDALSLTLPHSPSTSSNSAASLSAGDESFFPTKGVLTFAFTVPILDELGILLKRLRSNQIQKSDSQNKNFDSFSEAEIELDWDESSSNYAVFVKDLAALRRRAGHAGPEEAFDAHMAIGHSLYEHHLFYEALCSFRLAVEVFPTDLRPHFRAGSALYSLGRRAEAKVEFLLALEASTAGNNQWADLLPQIHVNLGIALEGEGLVLNACDHYREAAILSPNHFRALKLLGSALFGAGELSAAEKALQEAVFLRPDYADAHCDLGSVLHAMGEDERAVQEFQKAIDLKPGHVDALYNLGGLFMDAGRFVRASEMYARVLVACPHNWRAQLNKAVALLGAGEAKKAKKALKEALKLTQRTEVYHAISHLKVMEGRRKKKGGKAGELNKEGEFLVVEPSRFKSVGRKTTHREDLTNALQIRVFQRLTRLDRCDIEELKKTMNETDVPLSYSGGGGPVKSIRKAGLETILLKLLPFLRAETFQGSVKAINEKILSVLDSSGSGRVDLGMFFAAIAPICLGSTNRRKRIAFDSLLWRQTDGGNGELVRRIDAVAYMKLLKAVYIPHHGIGESTETQRESEFDPSMISFGEFLEMFDDPKSGFGMLRALVKLETGDRIRRSQHTCSVCRYSIMGSRFMEARQQFNLCSYCYSEGKVPSAFRQDEYRFKEYGSEAEAMKDKCACFSLNSKGNKCDR
ncbi:hypothetical protein KSP40_PGU017257 [Platanthera guangdongensis]|uniref:EF-hand domain-containing protein n=1 Tax=Platanthera guangdongensis TaxID=2320717 RepID=A0ABR2MZD9_9ASPA